MADQQLSDDEISSNDQIAFLEKLVDGLPIALFCKDYVSGVGRFVIWNRMAEDIWGLAKEKVVAKTDFDIFPIDQAQAFRQMDIQTMAQGHITFIPEEKADSPVLGQVSVRTWKITLKDQHGNPRFLIGVSQNISDIKELERELVDHVRGKMEAERISYQHRLARQVAHEMNNPLAIILGRVAQLSKMVGDHPALKVMPLLDSITKTAHQSKNSVEDLVRLLTESSQLHTNDQTVHRAENHSLAPFFNDINNSLAIATGRAQQITRILKDCNNKELAASIEPKILGVLDALKRIELQLQREKTLVK